MSAVREKKKKSVGVYVDKGGIRGWFHNFIIDCRRNKVVVLCLVVILAFFAVFNYAPMFGLLMAFERYTPAKGIFGSKWIGMYNFKIFFTGPYVGRLIKNTVAIGVLDLLVNFPAPIIFALLLNEIHQKRVKKTIQTISYMPHFVSTVVVCSLVTSFTQANGPISNFAGWLTGRSDVNLLADPKSFWGIYVLMNMWQGIGYGSIIYLSALSGVDQELYEAAEIDGANRWKQTLHVTIPGILPTIIMMLIMRMGGIFSVGADKIILLYTPATYETADVINTYVYRMGMLQQDYGLSTAVGLFNSIIGTIMLVTTNRISKKLSGTSWF